MFIREIEICAKDHFISELRYNESIIWNIFEYNYSWSENIHIRGLFLVHSSGVLWVMCNSNYKDLVLKDRNYFNDQPPKTGKVTAHASFSDFQEFQVACCFSTSKKLFVVGKPSVLYRYLVKDSAGKTLERYTIYETHSPNINITVVKCQYYKSTRKEFVYIGLTNGDLTELSESGVKRRVISFFKTEVERGFFCLEIVPSQQN